MFRVVEPLNLELLMPKRLLRVKQQPNPSLMFGFSV